MSETACAMSPPIPTVRASRLFGTKGSSLFRRSKVNESFSRASFSNGKRMIAGVLKPTPSSRRTTFFDLQDSRKSENFSALACHSASSTKKSSQRKFIAIFPPQTGHFGTSSDGTRQFFRVASIFLNRFSAS